MGNKHIYMYIYHCVMSSFLLNMLFNHLGVYIHHDSMMTSHAMIPEALKVKNSAGVWDSILSCYMLPYKL